MGNYNDRTIKEIVEEINVSYFLPDIQREYVWLDKTTEKKIEQLFDSIIRNYPIGSFLFWQLRKTDIETEKHIQTNSDKLSFQLYKFIEDYDPRNPHNEKIDISKVNSNNLNIVLDGQQRLTSLFIGLKGSRTFKKPKSKEQFEEKKLYLNLRYQPCEEDTEDCYQFEFKNPNQIPVPDKTNYWFKVGDILSLQSITKYCRENDLDDNEAELLEKLKNVICTERLISYFEEKEKNLDKVLKIFIRVNSGGTKLSYSDLLMSILTAYFSSDIRNTINSYVEKFKAEGFKCFGRDQILKTCLLLIKANHIFNLRNFNTDNIHSIEQNWEKISNTITDAIEIVKDFGYANQLTSGYIISVIALYLYNKDYTYNKINNNPTEKEAIFKFVRTAQITSYFTTSLDRKLSYILEGMNKATDFVDFNNIMAKMDANKALKVTHEDVDDLLTLQYGNPAILPILQLLYPNLNYKTNTFHIDHIYPKSKFTQKNSSLNSIFLNDKNYLFNLQLLEGAENISKKDLDPNIWVNAYFDNDVKKINEYKKTNYIDLQCTLQWDDFKTFKEKRNEELRRALKEALDK